MRLGSLLWYQYFICYFFNLTGEDDARWASMKVVSKKSDEAKPVITSSVSCLGLFFGIVFSINHKLIEKTLVKTGIPRFPLECSLIMFFVSFCRTTAKPKIAPNTSKWTSDSVLNKDHAVNVEDAVVVVAEEEEDGVDEVVHAVNSTILMRRER